MDATDIVVFLGPSLGLDDARRVLPARYLEPARCGDVLRARRLRPRAIAIVDGVFARSAAVWHKEVLVALDEGIDVYGASSMGALRAAELAPFGMVGVGRIFEAYRDGVLTDDDEVALLHGPAETGYREMSEAMVNIRATMAHAVARGVVGADAADAVVREAKATFYQERVLVRAIDAVWGSRAESAEAVRLKHFVSNGGYVNQKRIDALELLGRLATHGLAPTTAVGPVSRSTYLLRLHQEMMCAPFDGAHPTLPPSERVARRVTTKGPIYSRVRRLAHLLSIVHGMAARPDVSRPGAAPASADTAGPGRVVRTRRWADAHGLDPAEHARFLERLAAIDGVMQAYGRGRDARRSARRRDRIQLDLMRLDGAYGQFVPRRRGTRTQVDRAVLRNVARIAPDECRIYRLSAALWSVVEAWCAKDDIEPPTPRQALADTFRRSRALLDRDATLAWFKTNNLDRRRFVSLVTTDAMLAIVCAGSQAYALGLRAATAPDFWLLDAIRLAGLYRDLAREPDPARTTRRRARRGRSAVPQ